MCCVVLEYQKNTRLVRQLICPVGILCSAYQISFGWSEYYQLIGCCGRFTSAVFKLFYVQLSLNIAER